VVRLVAISTDDQRQTPTRLDVRDTGVRLLMSDDDGSPQSLLAFFAI
jgi:hypothetical protein